MLNYAFGRASRLRRLSHDGTSRALVVPLDHSVTDGPLNLSGGLADLVGELSANEVDAVVMHKGSVRQVNPLHFTRMSLIVHLSASTRLAPDPDSKYLVCSVEGALRLGAAAVSTHVNLGSRDERRQIADMASIADACDRWELPLLAMMYVRGPDIRNPQDPELVSHSIAVAADLGADLVKATYVGSAAEMADVVRAAPVPVLVAGGPRDSDDTAIAFAEDVIRSGAQGVAMGRNIFQSPTPGPLARKVAEVVHRTTDNLPARR